MSEASLPASGPTTGPMLRDFPDRLSPVLVKELRQGLRTRMFVIPFLVLHGLLVISSVDSRSGTGFFWACLIIMLVALLPMRNTAALSDERQSNTLDMLMLTRLTPWRIVWGKWSATFALVLVTAVSVIPYLLVRYLNGGSSFVQEGMVLAGLVLVSGAQTAILTALSSLHSTLARNSFAVLSLFPAWQFGCLPLLRGLEANASLSGSSPALLLAVLWMVSLFLFHAAASIAPRASNLTAPRRLVTAIAVVMGAMITKLPLGDSLLTEKVLMAMLVLVSAVEMGEPPVTHPGVGAAFARRKFPGKLAALFLHPGWASGVVFCATLWLWMHHLESRSTNLAALCFVPVLMGAPLLYRKYRGAGVMLCGMLLVQLLSSVNRSGLMGDPLPLAILLPAMSWRGGFPPMMAAVYGLAALVIALPSLRALWRRISRESSL
jgi:hypothetical protein